MKILIDNGHGSDNPGKRSPDGKWHTATGWSAYTSSGNTATDALATCLYESAARHIPGHRLRTDYTDDDPDIESGFYILRHTLCKAVLTENGFMDSRDSLAYITSDAGKNAIVRLNVDGICDYLDGQL